MLRLSGLVSLRALCSLFALSVVLTLALASTAFAQLVPEPTLSIDDVTVTEGDAGTTNATFTVTRSGDTTLISTVNFATADSTATQPGDYASVFGRLTFDPGETTKPVTVSVNGDTLDEADERFFVNLSTAVGATINDAQGVGTITDDDDTPQANDDGSPANRITLVEDAPAGVTTNVLANDSGLGDSPIEVAVTDLPNKGAATVDDEKTITYVPGENKNGDDTYSYTITDSDGQTSTATVFLHITAVNDAPTISSVTDSGSVSEGSPSTITVSATDLDGDSLSYEFDCNNDNTYEIGPQAAITAQCTFNDDGTRRVNVRVTDGNGGTATGFTNVTVNNVAPNAADDTTSADEGGPGITISVLANDTDVSGDPLTITNNTQPPSSEGSVNCSASECTFTPNSDFNGNTSFTYTVDDGDGGTDTATVSVAVNLVNDAPSFTKGTNQTVNEDAAAQSVPNWATGISTGPTDESAQSVEFTVTSDNNALFTATGRPAVSSEGTLTFTPAANANGTANVEVVAQDNGGTANGGEDTSDPQSFTITVISVNDAPTADAQSVSINEDNAKAITLSSSDADSDNLTYRITALPTNGALYKGDSVADADKITAAGTTLPGNQVTYKPTLSYNGSDSFSFLVNDGTVNSVDATVSITVEPVNDAPTVSDISDQTTDEDTPTNALAFTVGDVKTSATDLTVTGSSSNTALVPNSNTNIFFGGSGANRTVRITPAANQSGMATITVTVGDGNAEGTDTFVLTVRAADRVAPTIINVAPTGKKVSLRANVVATFSEVMMTSSLNRATVKLVKKGTTKKVAAALSYPAPNKVVLNPKRNLVRGAIYKVTIVGGASGAKDVAGNALAANKNWKFRVR